MGKNKFKGVITMVLGLVLIIAALVMLLVAKELDWAASALIGIGLTDVVFGILILFQPTREDIIRKYEEDAKKESEKNEEKETVQFVPPENLASQDQPEMMFDPNTGEPIK